ncbi:type VI secretion system ATPase TssH, partial [Candidatus Bathyarchaeota archaeon]|nr:type VI secretion system ATPase TssH [Candidatus Bathyarchaeota archaeon]
MNANKFTIKAQEAIQKAMEITTAKQNQSIQPIHLLKGMLVVDENVLPYLLGKLNVNLDRFSKGVDDLIDSLPKVVGGQQYFSSNANKALQKASELASEFKDEFVSIELLLLAIIPLNDNASRLLSSSGITEGDLKKAIKQLRKGSTVKSQTAEETYNALNKYALNINDLAQKGKLDPVIGRDMEIRRVLQI